MVMDVTGVERQLTPEEQQIVGTEIQEPRVPDSVLPRIEEPEKRVAPPPPLPRVPLPAPAQLAEDIARQTIFGVPILRINHYTGTDKTWQTLLTWTISQERTGDLHQISLLSDNDALTRYRIVIAGVDQEIPEDRQTSTPLTAPWSRSVLPPGSSVVVEVRSADGTNIIVDGMITGSER